MPPDLAPLLTMPAALGAVLLLVGLCGMLARRAGWGTARAPGRVLAVEEVVPLGGRHRLFLLRCGRRRAVVLTGGASDLLLGWLDETEGGA